MPLHGQGSAQRAACMATPLADDTCTRRQAVFCLLALCSLALADAMLAVSSMQTAAAGALWQGMVCS